MGRTMVKGIIRDEGGKLRCRDGSDNVHLRDLIHMVGRKWWLTILWELHRGPRGFNELKRRLGGISSRTLSMKLETLEKEGFIHREVVSERPLRVSYGLTEMGHGLNPFFAMIQSWVVDVNTGREAHMGQMARSTAAARTECDPQKTHIRVTRGGLE